MFYYMDAMISCVLQTYCYLFYQTVQSEADKDLVAIVKLVFGFLPARIALVLEVCDPSQDTGALRKACLDSNPNVKP